MNDGQRAAMTELLDRVEAGDLWDDDSVSYRQRVWRLICEAVDDDSDHWHQFFDAYDGDLNDALALLEWLLPGAYVYIMGPSVDGWHAGVTAPNMPCLWCSHPTSPARALLIATLKAKLGASE